MDELVRTVAPAIGVAGSAFAVLGIIYLGMNLSGIARGGGETYKALAMTVAGLTVTAFAKFYGY